MEIALSFLNVEGVYFPKPSGVQAIPGSKVAVFLVCVCGLLVGTSSLEDEIPGSRFPSFSKIITLPFSWVSFSKSWAFFIADSMLFVNSVSLYSSISSMAARFFFSVELWVVLDPIQFLPNYCAPYNLVNSGLVESLLVAESSVC